MPCPVVHEILVAVPALESFAFHGDIVYSSDGKDDEHATAIDLGATPAPLDTYLSHLGFGNEVLMTKFGKAEKTGLSGLPNRSIRFWQF
jgi:hypothetical protein